MSFIDFAEVEARCSIEQTANRLPTGDLTGYVGVTKGETPEGVSPFQRGQVCQEECVRNAPRKCGPFS